MTSTAVVTNPLKTAVLNSILGVGESSEVRIKNDAEILRYFEDGFYDINPTPQTYPNLPHQNVSYTFDNISEYFDASGTLPQTVADLDEKWEEFCLSTDASTGRVVNSVIGEKAFEGSSDATKETIRTELVNILKNPDLKGEKLYNMVNTENDLVNKMTQNLSGSDITLSDTNKRLCEDVAHVYLTYRYIEVIPINEYLSHDIDHPEPFLHKILRNLAKVVMVCKTIMKTTDSSISNENKVKIIKALVLIPFGLEYDTSNTLQKIAPANPIPDHAKMLEAYIESDLTTLVMKNVQESRSLVDKRLAIQEDTEKMGIVQRNLKSLTSNEERIRVRLQFMKAFLVGASVLAAAVAAAMAFGIVYGNGFVVFVVATLVVCLTLAYEVYDGILATVKVLD
jgi:hypothetical protein